MRLFFGALLSAALIAGGEWSRRNELASGFAGIRSAYIPGILTAAGTTCAYATVYAAYGLYGFGWALVLLATFLINHFDLFGLRQVWFHLRGLPYRPLPFRGTTLYRFVRHPLYVGWITLFWATPTMTATRLLFAVMTTAYILIAIQFEERDLVAEHGRRYAEYRRRVPMLIPSLKPAERKSRWTA